MKPLFTGKIVLSKHAKQRIKEREIDATYIRRLLSFIPYQEGIVRWHIPRTDLFVVFTDVSEEQRIIITIARKEKDWKAKPPEG